MPALFASCKIHPARTAATTGVLLALWTAAAVTAPQPQDPPEVQHARNVVEQMRAEKFDEVAREFDAKVASLMSAARLGEVWAMLRQQAGAFESFIDHRVSAAGGITAVVLGCRFEKTSLNVMVAFDAENKIAGLRFAPRPGAADTAPATPTSTRFKDEPVTIGAGEWALPGTLSMPVGQVAAALVLVHGSGPHDRDSTIGPNKPFRDLAWGLADRGIAVLRYEKRSHQHGSRMAAIKTLTVREEAIEDALLAAALLRKHDRIDPAKIMVLGHSLGGTLAPRIAAEDRALGGIIIMAGTPRPLLDVAREQLAYLGSLHPGVINTDTELERLRRMAPQSYWKDLDAHDPAQTAASLKAPILILHGERDYQVTMTDLEAWRKALGGRPNVTIKSYPALNHLFLPGEGKSTPADYERAAHIPDAVLDDIATWLRSR